MEIQGIGDMDKEMQEIAAVHAALQNIKTELQAFQANPSSPQALQNLINAIKAIQAASQLPLPPGTSYLTAELQSALKLVTTLQSIPITMPSCSSSNPDSIALLDSNGNNVTLGELMNNPSGTFHFSCHLDDGQNSFVASNWATQFHPGMTTDWMQNIPPSIDTVGGIHVDVGQHVCKSALEVNASAAGSQIASVGSLQMNPTASSAISSFINSIL